MKMPEEIADEVTGKKYIGTWGGLTANTRKIARDAAIIAIEADRDQIFEILDMDEDKLGDYNEWADVVRVSMIRDLLGERV